MLICSEEHGARYKMHVLPSTFKTPSENVYHRRTIFINQNPTKDPLFCLKYAFIKSLSFSVARSFCID